MKSYLRWSKASGSTKRLIERLVKHGPRTCRRALNAARRKELREGGDHGE